MLRIVMIGSAKLKVKGQSYHNFCGSKIITASRASLITVNLKRFDFHYTPPEDLKAR